MTDQLPLLVVETSPKLAARQQAVHAALQAAGADGLESSEAGAIAHELKETKWAHSRDDRCVYCGKDGRAILLRLAELGLARYRSRLKVWQTVGVPQVDPEVRGMLRDDEELPF